MSKTGHYESAGCTWEEGETPLCISCEERVAVWETVHSGIYLCDDDNCLLEYVRTESHAIEFFEDQLHPVYSYAGKLGPWARLGMEDVRYLATGPPKHPVYRRIVGVAKKKDSWRYVQVRLERVASMREVKSISARVGESDMYSYWCGVNTYRKEPVQADAEEKAAVQLMDGSPYELIIFDADGTLRRCTVEGQPCPNRGGEWALIPGVQERLGQIDWGVTGLGIASNQGGIAYGFLDERTAYLLLANMVRAATGRWAKAGSIRFCPHKAGDDCLCRKPRPGMLLAVMRLWNVAPSRTLFVGDMGSDRLAAEAAEVDFVWAADFFGREGAGGAGR